MDLSALLNKVGEEAPMPSCEARNPNRFVVAHMDGDYAAYFCAGSDNCSAGDARRNVLSRISRLRTVSGAGHVVMHLTHGASTKGDRFLAATSRPYQGQRTHSTKPKQWAFLREWMECYDGPAFSVKLWKDREADDGMAHSCHAAASLRNVLHVVHTADKDMRMFCGTHVAWNDFRTTDVPLQAFDVVGSDDKQYGHKWFWMQMVQGDNADNIPGIPGAGPAAATGLLKESACNEDAFVNVSEMYRAKLGDGWADYFVEQAALLWMRTDYRAQARNFLSLGCFSTEVHDAVLRMEERIRAGRSALRRLSE